MIWDFGRTSSLIDMERSKAQQTYYHLELAKEDLVIEAINAWLNLMKTYDAIIVPGGFSYGDYLRTGAIARFSPIMSAVVQEAKK